MQVFNIKADKTHPNLPSSFTNNFVNVSLQCQKPTANKQKTFILRAL